jgi:hypothetical protein
LFIALFIYFFKARRTFQRFTRYINLVLIVLIFFETGRLIIKSSRHAVTVNKIADIKSQNCDTCLKPDIYLILADEYAGHQELQDLFGFDNSNFENDLRSRGFYIVRGSKSNYNYTPFSVASMLNMDFLTNIEGRNSSRQDMNICYDKINKNQLLNYLKQYNYTIINNSIFNLDNIHTKAQNSFLKTGKEIIEGETFWGRINRDIRFNLVTRFKILFEVKKIAFIDLNNNTLLLKNTIKESKAKSNKPRFVYSHLVMPHYPYYFDKNGNPYPLEYLSEGNQASQEKYIEYLQYCNNQFLDLIDQILRASKTPPIILFMGDHGFRHFTTPVDPSYHFMNMNAIYLPRKKYNSFYDGMSNVNVFRVLLNTQFNLQLPLLKDSTSFLKE